MNDSHTQINVNPDKMYNDESVYKEKRKPVMCDIKGCVGAVVDIIEISGSTVGLCRSCGCDLISRCSTGIYKQKPGELFIS